ncbi:MAG: C4-dicarboxylate TRAP transporter substrate-binding protein [Spirochaetales bacterium]|jgi:tripartite ATP-independent transporter DctP family solute receptor|nr:C4-dicarboxylate TRAP transporter substrate-binding protein [Spirochaetales bacterium]
MKRLFVSLLVIALAAASLYAGGSADSSAAAGQKLAVQIGYENNPGEPVDLAIHEWKRLLEERSQGAMEMQIFPSSQMGTKNEIIDQMLAGMASITLADGAFFADRGVGDLGITMAPYLFSSWDEAWKLVESDWWDGQMKLLQQKGLRVLAANFIYGDRHTLTKRPIRTVDDFRGLKLRVPNNLIQVRGTEIMGATPTPLPLGEVYTALQQGVVDGVENPLPVLDGGKFQEVAKYLTLDAHIKLITSWFCGEKFFGSLTPEQQKLLVESGQDAGRFNNTLQEKAAADVIEKFKAEGVEIITIDMAAFQAKAKGFYDLPDIKEKWTPGLFDIVSKAKAIK